MKVPQSFSTIGTGYKNFQIVNLYKRYFDKCSLLRICGEKFEKMSDLFSNKEKAKILIQMTKYAVNFVSTQNLIVLAKSMNENIDFFNCDEYDEFHES